MRGIRTKLAVGLAAIALLAAGCGTKGGTAAGGGPCTPAKSPVITLAAYSTVYDIYGKLITDFQTKWKDAARRPAGHLPVLVRGQHDPGPNVANGFPADVVALSLAPDVDIIQEAGLITHDWTSDTDGGDRRQRPPWSSTSGTDNPKNIHDWSRPDPAGGGDPDPRPLPERRGQVEHRGRLRGSHPREGPRLRPAARPTPSGCWRASSRTSP